MSERICFVIAPIGELETETRKRSDQVLKHIIAPAVKQFGYSALRADQMSEPGMITSQVIQHIVDDPLVVADLTDRNPNVFYELAIRHAIRKPLIQIIRKGDTIPFDVAGTRTIHVDHHDLDSVEAAKSEIIAQIKSLEASQTSVETPISVSLDLQTLRGSANPEQRSLGDILAVVTDIRTAFGSLDERLRSTEHLSAVMMRETMLRREHQSENSRARLLAASRELRDAVRQLTIMSDTPDEDRSRQLTEVLMRLDRVISVLPEA